MTFHIITKFTHFLHFLLQHIGELQEKSLAAGRVKVEAVSEARDAVRQEMQAELENLRKQLTQVNFAGINAAWKRCMYTLVSDPQLASAFILQSLVL